jgi:putative transposase
MDDLQFFDPKQEYSVAWKTLPHWAQAGTLCFITWRTADSLPAAADRRITQQRFELLHSLGLQSNPHEQLSALKPADRRRVQWQLFSIIDRELDHNFGECLLARPDCSLIVEESLMHFDGSRYLLTDFVVMPNHVHVLVAFRDDDSLITQCESWKRYTARQINQIRGRCGEFWQIEQFDHLVRGSEQFEYFQNYIAENPKNANLNPGSYRHYSKLL